MGYSVMTALVPEMDDATAAELDRIGADAVAHQATTTNGGAELVETSVVAEAGPAARTQAAPLITVLKGEPTDAELAALVAVLTAAAHAPDARSAGPVADEVWGHPTLMHRTGAAFSPTTFALSAQLRQ
jgi:hypothetical protein